VEDLNPVGCYAILNDSFDIHIYSTSAMLRGINNILTLHLKKCTSKTFTASTQQIIPSVW